MQKSKKSKAIPDEFASLKEASDFWDVHDISDYWKETRPADFKVSLKKEPKYVALEDEIAKKLFKTARKKHTSSETLVNLWLKEKLMRIGA